LLPHLTKLIVIDSNSKKMFLVLKIYYLGHFQKIISVNIAFD